MPEIFNINKNSGSLPGDFSQSSNIRFLLSLECSIVYFPVSSSPRLKHLSPLVGPYCGIPPDFVAPDFVADLIIPSHSSFSHSVCSFSFDSQLSRFFLLARMCVFDELNSDSKSWESSFGKFFKFKGYQACDMPQTKYEGCPFLVQNSVWRSSDPRVQFDSQTQFWCIFLSEMNDHVWKLNFGAFEMVRMSTFGADSN